MYQYLLSRSNYNQFTFRRERYLHFHSTPAEFNLTGLTSRVVVMEDLSTLRCYQLLKITRTDQRAKPQIQTLNEIFILFLFNYILMNCLDSKLIFSSLFTVISSGFYFSVVVRHFSVPNRSIAEPFCT